MSGPEQFSDTDEAFEVGLGNRLTPWALNIAWILISLLGIAYLFYNDFRRAEHDVSELHERLSQYVSDRILISEITVEGFAAFSRSMDALNAPRASGYARQLLDRYPFLYMLELVQLVPRVDRAAYERRLSALYPGFEIRDFGYDSDRRWQRAPERPYYYPIVFQEPLLVEANVLGLDISSNANLRQAMVESAKNDGPIATVPIVLAEGDIGYVLHRALDPIKVAAGENRLSASTYALLALKAKRLFADLDQTPSGISVVLHHRAFTADDPAGQLIVNPSDHSPGSLERLLLPRFVRITPLSNMTQPFTLQLDWQLGWNDLSLAEATLIVVLSVMLFFIVKFSMHDYFQRQVLSLKRQGVLFEMANFDALTGLANRMRLLDQLEATLLRNRRTNAPVGLLFIDVERFKQVNDRCGHVVGDAVLVEVATRLGRHLREGDTLGRYGGDEFLLVCSDIQSAESLRFLVRRLKREFERPIEVARSSFDIGISVGIAIFPEDGRNVQALINTADRAMYQDKRNLARGR